MRKPIFDWTVNLGHILTFIGFMLTGAIAYSTLERRVAVIESASVYQIKRDENQDTMMKEYRSDLKDTLRDIQAGVERLSIKTDAALARK